jgi:hypothetical protein
MRRIRSILTLLLSDERSAVRRNTAVLFSLAVLVTAVAGLVLVSLGEQTYRDLDRRVLRASQDLARDPLV